MSEALKDEARLTEKAYERVHVAGLEDVDLSILKASTSLHEPNTDVEQEFIAVSGREA